jgi:hypothetical protein
MKKITLLYHPDEHSNFTAVHLEPLWKKYFEFESIDTNKTYNKCDVVLVSKHLNKDRWYTPWCDQGYRLIIDHLWDNNVSCSSVVVDNVLIINAPNWSWFNESLWYKQLKYDRLNLARLPDKFFLTLMRIQKDHRSTLFDAIQHFRIDSLISYTDLGVFIPGDCDVTDECWQRHVNIDWYNHTCFSLVAETMIDSPTFISEKTFKPIAFQHPFLIFGSPGTLEYLHKNNFETFDHVIDESYDQETNTEIRFEKIINQTNLMYQQYLTDPRFFCDTITIQKLQHNFNHFYDQDLMTQMFDKEVIAPMLNFIETR